MTYRTRLRRGVSLEVIVEEDDRRAKARACVRLMPDALREVDSGSDTASNYDDNIYDVVDVAHVTDGGAEHQTADVTDTDHRFNNNNNNNNNNNDKRQDGDCDTTSSSGSSGSDTPPCRSGTASSGGGTSNPRWYQTLDPRRGRLSRARSVSCEALTMDSAGASDWGAGEEEEEHGWGDTEENAAPCIAASTTVSRRRILKMNQGSSSQGDQDSNQEHQGNSQESQGQRDPNQKEGRSHEATAARKHAKGVHGNSGDDVEDSNTRHCRNTTSGNNCSQGSNDNSAVPASSNTQAHDTSKSHAVGSSTGRTSANDGSPSAAVDAGLVSGGGGVADAMGSDDGGMESESDDGGGRNNSGGRSGTSAGKVSDGGEKEDDAVGIEGEQSAGIDSFNNGSEDWSGDGVKAEVECDGGDKAHLSASGSQAVIISQQLEEGDGSNHQQQVVSGDYDEYVAVSGYRTSEGTEEDYDVIGVSARTVPDVSRTTNGRAEQFHQNDVTKVKLGGKIPFEKFSVNLTKKRRNMRDPQLFQDNSTKDCPVYDPKEILQNDQLVIIEKEGGNTENVDQAKASHPACPAHPSREASPAAGELPPPHIVSSVRRFFEDTAASIDNINQKRFQGRFREVRSNPSSKILRFDRHSELHTSPPQGPMRHSGTPLTSSKYSQTLPRAVQSNWKKKAVRDWQAEGSPGIGGNALHFYDIPPHVFRITAEIAEYQERVEDVKNMKRVATGATMAESKKNIMSELSRALDKSNSNELLDIARHNGADHCEHTHILHSLKLGQQTSSPRHRDGRRGSRGCSSAAATTERGIVQLRKPSLAKGFNVQKALQDNPRYFHMTAPSPPCPGRHGGVEEGNGRNARRAAHTKSNGSPDRCSDVDSLSSDTSADSGVSDDSSASAQSNTSDKTTRIDDDRRSSSSNWRHRSKDSKPCPSRETMGDDHRHTTATLTQHGRPGLDNTLHGPNSRRAQHFADPSFKWIDPEILAKIRSVGTTVIFFGPRSRSKDQNTNSNASESRHPPQKRIAKRLPLLENSTPVTEDEVITSNNRASHLNNHNNNNSRKSHPTHQSSTDNNDAFSTWSYSESPSSVYSTIQSINNKQSPVEGTGKDVNANEEKVAPAESHRGTAADVRKQLELVLKSELQKIDDVDDELDGGLPPEGDSGNCSTEVTDVTETSNSPSGMRGSPNATVTMTNSPKGRHVTLVRVTAATNSETLEAVMSMGEEETTTDTESGNSTDSTPRVVGVLRKSARRRGVLTATPE